MLLKMLPQQPKKATPPMKPHFNKPKMPPKKRLTRLKNQFHKIWVIIPINNNKIWMK